MVEHIARHLTFRTEPLRGWRLCIAAYPTLTRGANFTSALRAVGFEEADPLLAGSSRLVAESLINRHRNADAVSQTSADALHGHGATERREVIVVVVVVRAASAAGEHS